MLQIFPTLSPWKKQPVGLEFLKIATLKNAFAWIEIVVNPSISSGLSSVISSALNRREGAIENGELL